MTRKKREEATLLGYSLLYNKAGNLVTERISTDVTKLKKFLSREEYAILETVVRDATVALDKIHNYIETNLNARKMTE
jgi:hypothetical protein|tara:strand:+ start:119 stop:352 length:234 start_codon:yes stop_codon:yes gene_type:complete